MIDLDALLRLADRLDQESRPYVALAARQAARTLEESVGPSERDVRVATLRRQAIEIALRLDILGLDADAQAVFDEIVRRATGAERAMADRPFQAWLDAIAAQFSLGEGAEP